MLARPLRRRPNTGPMYHAYWVVSLYMHNHWWSYQRDPQELKNSEVVMILVTARPDITWYLRRISIDSRSMYLK